ncbi:hypothetical protein GGTG_07775 [Gaeumannomyces tritici R3-111a-1]|uniref:Uncharacterized protein n=1 Tax=Gaeumannomyces tritici (strain R3-111a-1) TaxID=644352 RepID=J3P2M9_GAET3|nr:hypothetical protein GGTG_07775 [Gaeumannomyces tritici R3-111a-1]EJT73921.1 hypothetical protein GGTG_07775 [Gaeumannomyces tritici R3-111a-1]
MVHGGMEDGGEREREVDNWIEVDAFGFHCPSKAPSVISLVLCDDYTVEMTNER